MGNEFKPLLSYPIFSYRKAGIISKILFWYAFPLVRKAQGNELSSDDLEPNLDENDSKHLADQLQEAYNYAIKRRVKHPLQSALWNTFKFRIIWVGIVCFIKDGFWTLSQNLLLGYFIRSFTTSGGFYTQAVFGAALVLTILVQLFFSQGATYLSLDLAIKIRISLSALVYRKALRTSLPALDKIGTGRITNSLATDAAIFYYSIQYMHYIWIAPLVTLLSTAIIWTYVGPAVFAGVGLTLILIPFLTWTSKWFVLLRQRIAASTDARLNLLQSLFSGILTIKMYTWEVPFVNLVKNARLAEIKNMLRRALLNTSLQSLLQVIPKIALFSVLVIYVIQGNSLDAETAFVSVSLLSMVAALMTAILPASIGMNAESLVGIQRIDHLLQAEEKVISYTPPWHKTSTGIKFNNISTTWTDNEENCLENLNLNVTPGKLVCIMGPVGAGKSTALLTVLGETQLSGGTVEVHGSIGYASQNPCLFSTSVRENILFGSSWDPVWYDKVVDACGLVQDFGLLPHRDLTLVADMGKTLSGGQKARISLARAVYRKADIYLLDDPLSAVDATVGRYIYDKCIRGLLKPACVILTTHSINHARHADEIILLEKGIVQCRGSYDELCVAGYITETKVDKVDDVTTEQKQVTKRIEDEKTVTAEAETSTVGAVRVGLVWKFLRFGNSLLIVCSVVLLTFLNQIGLSISDLYLKLWTSREELMGGVSRNQGKYVVIYSLLMLPVFILPFLRTFAHNVVCLRSAAELHDAFVWAVTRAPLNFFWKNSEGRIMNRVSKDIGIIDEQLQQTTYIFIGMLFQCFGNIVLISMMNVILVVPSVLLVLALSFVQKIYMKPASSIARLESIQKSSVFAYLGSSLYGLTTIRAYRAEHQFIETFDNYQNIHSRGSFAQMVLIQWFGIVTQLLSFVYFFLVSLTFVFSVSDASAVGLAVSSTLGISSMLAMVLQKTADLGTQLVCVERILEYTKILPEETRIISKSQIRPPSSSWPSFGRIQILNATVSYVPGKNVLHNISCNIQPNEKVGIVGRTGAGKTTLVQALFRIFEINSGSILIDGIDISRLSIQELRSRLCIIPQDPILFKGTLRQNLDPVDEYEDSDLWDALKETSLTERINDFGLETPVLENGANFSQGERQLISFSRALLKKSKIVILDEATAHMDSKTDIAIQKVVRNAFKFCTVLTIAHRLGTILDSDRVCVMEDGKILEFDTPPTLLANESSRLSGFVRKANMKQLSPT